MTKSPADKPWLDSYAPGVPHELVVPEGSLSNLIAESVATYPKNVALEFFGRETTYAELGEQIRRAAEGLRRLGVKAGDRVAIILPNCPQHVVAFYAALRIGAIVVEHNPLYTPRELRHQFEDHQARVAIAWDKTVPTLQDFPSDLALDNIVSVDMTRAFPLKMRALLKLPIEKARSSRSELTLEVHGTTPWEKLLDGPEIPETVPRPGGESVALIQYTSGTTGSPKGAMLSHRNMLANAAQARAWTPSIGLGTASVHAVLPLFHAYGLTLSLTFAMSIGGRLVLFPKPDPDLVLPVIKKRPPTFLPAVPPLYDRFRKAAEAKGISLDGIQIAISGAMPLSKEVVEPWEALTGGYLVEGYGLSECSPVLMANPVAPNRKAGTVGLPIPGTELRVVDPDEPTRDVEPGTPGELVVRGPQVFSGYWNKPEESAAVFTEGWFRTGDIVTVDDEGFVTITDRIKELVITGGFNVAPSEVEETLRRYDGVEDVAIVGIPNDRDGEHVVAAIVLEPGASVDAEALRAWAKQQLAAYKVPKRVHVVDELPKSMIGKVLRRKVRDALIEKEQSKAQPRP